jgi:hypothetical protein
MNTTKDTTKKGRGYEAFVGRLQQALLNAEPYANQKNIEVELNKKITDACGIEREFDVYWEYELGGVVYKTVIECKNYNSKITIDRIDALLGKIADLPDIKPIFATHKGYQSGAITKANQHKIDLLIVREQNDNDWIDEEGNHRLREVHICHRIQMPPRILSFKPELDGNWVKNNTNIDVTQPFQMVARVDRIFIDDLKSGEKYSICDLASKLSSLGPRRSGIFTKKIIFENAFVVHQDTRLKLHSYEIEYAVSEDSIIETHFDYSKELVGIIEYLSKGTATLVFEKGTIEKRKLGNKTH